MPQPNKLGGLRVLVTRPARQAKGLARRIEAAGGHPVLWPTLEIVPPTDPSRAAIALQRLNEYDLVVFVSPNAVTQSHALLCGGKLPTMQTVATVGEGTARALREQTGRSPDLIPAERFDSEGLLALSALQVMTGKNVLIVRGEGGRELLAETLRARGAQVEYAEVYRRICPPPPPKAVAALLTGQINVITVTSAEALRNLVASSGTAVGALFCLPLVVNTERLRPIAAELGFRGPVFIAGGADEESLVNALIEALTRWRVAP